MSYFSSHSALGKALRMPLRLIPPQAVVRVLSGGARGMRWTVGAATHGCWLGTYETEKQRLFADAIKEGDTIYDIGAHAGFYSLLAARRAGRQGRVIAFEPLPRNIRFFRDHIRLNGLSNVELIEAAASDHSGVAHFEESPASQMGRLAEEGQLQVSAVAIDELIASNQLPPPAVVKMDVEGGEVRALEGMRETLRAGRPKLFLATHGDELNVQCFSLLHSLGYEIAPIDGEPISRTREVLAV